MPCSDPNRDALVIQHYQAGASPIAIAALVGITSNGARSILRRCGIITPKPKHTNVVHCPVCGRVAPRGVRAREHFFQTYVHRDLAGEPCRARVKDVAPTSAEQEAQHDHP